jgi:hypothetical protein
MGVPVRIGIVGSRRRCSLYDRKIVLNILLKAKEKYVDRGIVVVSGGARGPDTFAREAAKSLDLSYSDHPVPKDPPVKNKYEFRQRAFARNRDIVIDSDILFALVHRDRKGGTEDTVGHAVELQKRFFLVDEEGRCYLSGAGWDDRYAEETDETRAAQAQVRSSERETSSLDVG